MFVETNKEDWKLRMAFKDIEDGMFWKHVVDKYQLNSRDDKDNNIISAIVNLYRFTKMTKRR